MLIIVPARRSSARLPDKPLRLLGGKPMIQHTLERCLQTNLRVVCAVDDDKVGEVAAATGAEVFMTPVANLRNGTERVAWVAEEMGLPTCERIINVQGDKFMVDPSAICEMNGMLRGCAAPDKHRNMFAMREHLPQDEHHDKAIVKVITDSDDNALLFTRSYVEGADKHCGIYGYHVAFLEQYRRLPSHRLESNEGLEQMRVLDNGGRIYCPFLRTGAESGAAINTPADYDYWYDKLKET